MEAADGKGPAIRVGAGDANFSDMNAASLVAYVEKADPEVPEAPQVDYVVLEWGGGPGDETDWQQLFLTELQVLALSTRMLHLISREVQPHNCLSCGMQLCPGDSCSGEGEQICGEDLVAVCHRCYKPAD